LLKLVTNRTKTAGIALFVTTFDKGPCCKHVLAVTLAA
jgi:SWIM zinc finger